MEYVPNLGKSDLSLRQLTLEQQLQQEYVRLRDLAFDSSDALKAAMKELESLESNIETLQTLVSSDLTESKIFDLTEIVFLKTVFKNKAEVLRREAISASQSSIPKNDEYIQQQVKRYKQIDALDSLVGADLTETRFAELFSDTSKREIVSELFKDAIANLMAQKKVVEDDVKAKAEKVAELDQKAAEIMIQQSHIEAKKWGQYPSK